MNRITTALTRSSCRPGRLTRIVQAVVAVLIGAFALSLAGTEPVLAGIAGLGAIWVLIGAMTGRCPGLSRPG